MFRLSLGLRYVATLVFSFTLLAPVMAASPRLSIIMPRGVQRGTEQVLTFSGSQLSDAQEILFYDRGFEVTKIEADGKSVKVTVKLAADCRLGEHVAQVRTASGISDYRTFFVEALPVLNEKEPNNDFTTPQEIALNSVVAGIVQSEDVDYFAVQAKKGQRLSAEVLGMRLGTALFDPYVAILDSKRFELAVGDDTPLALQDSVASIVVPEDGQYVIEVRESAYGGNGNCRYRLNVGSFPRPTAVFPAGAKVGDEIDVQFLGDPTGTITQKVKLPMAGVSDFGLFAQDEHGVAPTPNLFRLFEHGNAFEQEPNEALKTASPVELPLAFNGIVEKAGDVDYFKFQAKKGQVFDVECYARRIRSALDPVMHLFQADGKSIAGSDDSRGPDSYFRFTVPADGTYAVRVRDHLGRGGSDFVYRVEFHPVRPQLALSIPRVERYGQYRQTIFVARGNRYGTLINASRSNFGGELILENKGLPAGITVHAESMPANLSSMPVVFEAAADAPIAGQLVDFTARLADAKSDLRGGFRNSADLIVGAPGQSLYKSKQVDRLAIAVVDQLPFKLEIVEPKVPLVRNGSMQLRIVAERQEGFKQAINVQLPFRPPGVGASSSVNIPADKNEVLYPINANGSAQLKKWKIFALGSANAGGTAWVSSQLTTLEVAEPFVTFDVQRTSCEQGQEAQVYCKISHKTDFAGEAKVELLGLPPKTSTPVLPFTKATNELTFAVKTEAASPVGKYKNVFCRVTITQNGEPIVSRAGGTELQIDKPLPPPPDQPKTVPKPKPKAPGVAKKPTNQPKPKPLSRLEKLRLAAKQRAEAKAAAAGN